MKKAIGMVEYKTVSTGVKAADIIVKTADVELLQAQTVCPGKFIVMYAGDLSAVRAATDAAQRPHESIFRALTCTSDIGDVKALGVLETFTAAAIIVAADHAAKTADVELFEIRVARGMCGKSYLFLTGTVAAVTEAIASAAAKVGEDGVLLDTAVIPNPSRDFVKTLI